MADLTRGNILDRVEGLLGNETDTTARTWMETAYDNMLYALWDAHDWEFTHKQGSFNTASGTEEYDLSSSITDIRSSNDLEVLYDSTNGTWLRKAELKNIRKTYPKQDTSGKPTVYAPWGDKDIILTDEPNGTYAMKALYKALPTMPSSDSSALEAICGLPLYIQYLFEKMCIAEGMFFYDDDRRTALLVEIDKRWLPKAIEADMRHLESGARFKFWEEEIAETGRSFNDFLRGIFTDCNDY